MTQPPSQKKEMTVPGIPVGAGTEQSPKTNKLSIAHDDDNCNPLSEVKIYLAEKDKREAGFIPTKPCLSVTNLNDLYSYSFKGTPPIIENFLYPEVQILAAAPTERWFSLKKAAPTTTPNSRLSAEICRTRNCCL